MSLLINPRPFGIVIAQTWIQIGTIFENIDLFDITLFVELGVYKGGLAELLIMRQSLCPKFKYFGVDNQREQLDTRMMNHPQILIADIFDKETQSIVSRQVQESEGVTLIYCDDGDKPKEMKTYTPLLRKGDLIMAHDYPGEITDKSLAEYGKEFTCMKEVNSKEYREYGFSLWRRI